MEAARLRWSTRALAITAGMEAPSVADVVEGLRREPARLREEEEELSRQLRELSLEKSAVHLAAHNADKQVSACVHEVHQHLSAATQQAAALAATQTDALRQANTAMEAVASVGDLSDQQSTLHDVLELPQVMEACVRAGMAGDAAKLGGVVLRLHLAHGGPAAPESVQRLLETLVSDAVAALREQVARLQRALQRDATVSAALDDVGHLRDTLRLLQGLDEAQEPDAEQAEAACRAAFLAARQTGLGRAGEGGTGGSGRPGAAFRRQTDTFARVVRDTCAQYGGIFHSGVPPLQVLVADTPFALWLEGVVRVWVDDLVAVLPKVHSSADVAALQEAALHACAVLGGLGTDPSPQVQAHFQAHVVGQLALAWAAGAESLTSTIASAAASQRAGALVGGGDLRVGDAPDTGSGAGSAPSTLAVPTEALRVPCVGAFAAACQRAWKEWRALVPPGGAAQVQAALDLCCGRVASALRTLQRSVVQGGGARDVEWRHAADAAVQAVKLGALPVLEGIAADVQGWA